MQKLNLSKFTKGRFIGDFEPSLHKTQDFEVAVKTYKQGDHEEKHYHKIATEYTIINQGKFRMGDTILSPGDIMIISPNEATDFECLEDGSNTVVKIPCVKGDKYLVEE